jgi:3'-5' exonuclease
VIPPILVFDIETIPDVAGLRRLHDLDASLDDAAVAEHAFALRREKTGGDFLQHAQHRVVAISCVMRKEADDFAVWSLGKPDDTEAELISKFFALFERFSPQLVSWNGGGFDLPVLNARSMINNITAARYWDWGDDDRDFKYNNYLNRYHSRHIDLMDLMAMFNARANTALDDMAKLCGLPGKLGMDGGQVWPAYQRGEIKAIRDYCETDVVNTYLLYLRLMKMRGEINLNAFNAEVARVRDKLATPEMQAHEHWQQYLAKWSSEAT